MPRSAAAGTKPREAPLSGISRATAPKRRALTSAELARMLELRAHYPDLGNADVERAATDAVTDGVGALVVRPEHVPLASRVVHGSGVRVVTGVDFLQRREPLQPPVVLAKQARLLAEAGANSLALIATQQRLADGTRFTDAIRAVSAAARSHGARSRVLIDVAGLTPHDVVETAVLCVHAGASVIQAGAWEGARATFNLLRPLRAAVGPDVVIKWTPEVRSVDALLLGVAEGANRFNGDIKALLQQARARGAWIPLTVPVAGVDY